MNGTTYTPTGRNLVAGNWRAGPRPFRSTPVHGPAHDFTAGSPEMVDVAVCAAEEAFAPYGQAPAPTAPPCSRPSPTPSRRAGPRSLP